MSHRQFSPEELCSAHLVDHPARSDGADRPARSDGVDHPARSDGADPLAAPWQDPPWSDCDVLATLRVLHRNKVPLAGLVGPAGAAILLNDARFQAARQAEESDLTSLRKEYELVRERLGSEGILGVLIKAVGLTPSFPYKSDNLDVLYKPRDVGGVRNVLRELGYVELKNVEEPLKYLFRKFHGGRSVSAIHVHEHVGWMVSFLDEEALWQRCRAPEDDPLLAIPAAEDGLLTTLAHFFYEDKRVTLMDVAKCAHCLRRGVDWDEVFRVAAWRGWSDGLNVALLLYAHQERALYGETLVPPAILERACRGIPAWARVLLEQKLGRGALTALCRGCSSSRSTFVARDERRARRGEWGESWSNVQETPLRIPFVFSKLFFYAKLVRDPTRSVSRRCKDLALHTGYGTKLRLHILSQPAMLVSFSGVDGCGKTTQAGALQVAFETSHLRTIRVWSRGGSSPWVGLFTRWSKPQPSPDAGVPTVESTVESRQRRFRSPWKRWGWSWLTTTELLWQYTWRVTLPLLLGRVVICDRYIYDALADWAVYFHEDSVERRLAARALRWLSPRPRIAYWLDVTADTASLRSSDGLPLDFLEAQSAAYARLAQLFGLRRSSLAARTGPESTRRDEERQGLAWEEISDRVVCEVLSTYFADYHTFINGVFLKNPGQWR